MSLRQRQPQSELSFLEMPLRDVPCSARRLFRSSETNVGGSATCVGAHFESWPAAACERGAECASNF